MAKKNKKSSRDAWKTHPPKNLIFIFRKLGFYFNIPGWHIYSFPQLTFSFCRIFRGIWHGWAREKKWNWNGRKKLWSWLPQLTRPHRRANQLVSGWIKFVYQLSFYIQRRVTFLHKRLLLLKQRRKKMTKTIWAKCWLNCGYGVKSRPSRRKRNSYHPPPHRHRSCSGSQWDRYYSNWIYFWNISEIFHFLKIALVGNILSC